MPAYLIVYLAVGIDLAILIAASASTSASAFYESAPSWRGLMQLSTITLFALWLFFVAKLHRVELIGNYRRYFQRFTQAWCVLVITVLALDAVLQFSAKPDGHTFGAQAATLLGWLTFCGVALAVARGALAALFRYCVDRELIVHDVVIVGATELAAQFIQRAAAERLGIRPSAIFHDEISSTTPRAIADVPVCGGIDDLIEYHKHNRIADVVIALPLEHDERVHSLVRQLSIHPLKISMLPGPLAAVMPAGWCAPPGDLPGIHLLPLIQLPISLSGRLVKTAFDRLVALIALLLFAPVMVACVIGIKLTSPGSVFYRQRRIGYRNAEFMVFKFRSMHESACDTGKLTVRDDPRVFGFGLFMRKFSLDELPQLFNVLLGDMSLVGPRPHMPEAAAAGQLYSEAVPEYPARHRVKPGITGWAQVSGWRGPTETLYQIEQRVAHDLHYIENWSFWLDIKILVKTCVVGFFGQNAF